MPGRRRNASPAALVPLLALVLLGASPCSFDYVRSRTCSALSMEVTIGQPGVLVPDCLGTSPMQITFQETITYPTVPPSLVPTEVLRPFGREILITPTAFATPGPLTLVLHTEPAGRGNRPPTTYTITIRVLGVARDAGTPPPAGDRCPRMPQPTPGAAFVTATASPGVVAATGVSRLSELVTNGVGPYVYAWRGYTDRSASASGSFPASDPASNPSLPGPLAQGFAQFEDTFFFVDVTDQGVAAVDPNRVLTGCVRVHQSDGPVARFTAAPESFYAGSSDVTLDPSGSTGSYTDVSWAVEYFGDVQPSPTTLEDYLRIGDFGWSSMWSQDSAALLGTTVPASVFTQPGVYRVGLTMFDVGTEHSTFEFLQILPRPPDAGATDAGLPDAGPADAGAPDAGPPPVAPVASVTTSSSDVIPQNGSTTLTCSVANGVGPFDFAWHGYRDDGAPGPGPFVLSSSTGSSVAARLVFPTSDFYFFCVATDLGLPANAPDRTSTGYIKLHESDGPVGRFTLGPGPFHFGVENVTADASASSDLTAPVTWTVEHYIGPNPPVAELDLEGYLSLYSSVTTVWAQLYEVDSVPLNVTIPAATFPAPGIYRLRLDVFDSVFNSHSSYQYFSVLP